MNLLRAWNNLWSRASSTSGLSTITADHFLKSLKLGFDKLNRLVVYMILGVVAHGTEDV